MVIDFTKVKSGQDFEDLCADLLEAEGFKVRHSGVGPDRGMDIIAEKDFSYGVGNPERFIWLIQCKHKNKGSVDRSDLRDYIKDIPKHGADGYFLITDTHLASTVEDDLTNVDKSNDFRFKARYWDKRILENKLNQHQWILEKYGLGEPKKVAHEKRKWYEFNPYKLLDSYNENDKEYFFGRDEDVTELLELVYRHNIVVLFGESGTGKTSVLNAGLIPKLRDNNFLIAYVRCLDDPVTRLRKEVIGRLSALETKFKINLDGLSAAKNVAEFIRELQTLLEQRDTKMVVVIDQFEEAFTRAGERDRLQLAEGITELTSILMSKGRLVFLFSIREDYLGNLWDWSYENKVGEAWNNTYHLKRLSDEEALEAITKPAEMVLVEYKNDLRDKILQDLKRIGDNEIYPPYLQIVCSTIFDEIRRSYNDKMIVDSVTIKFKEETKKDEK